MIQAIIGRKGSGKTKRLIDLTNEALKVEHGNIVFVDDDKRYMYDLRHEIRFVDASEYLPQGHRSPDSLISLLSGMIATNYDITLVCVDGFKKLVCSDWSELQNFFERLDALSKNHNCNFLLSLSAGEDELPEFILKYAV